MVPRRAGAHFVRATFPLAGWRGQRRMGCGCRWRATSAHHSGAASGTGVDRNIRDARHGGHALGKGPGHARDQLALRADAPALPGGYFPRPRRALRRGGRPLTRTSLRPAAAVLRPSRPALAGNFAGERFPAATRRDLRQIRRGRDRRGRKIRQRRQPVSRGRGLHPDAPLCRRVGDGLHRAPLLPGGQLQRQGVGGALQRSSARAHRGGAQALQLSPATRNAAAQHLRHHRRVRHRRRRRQPGRQGAFPPAGHGGADGAEA
mmetsp:Transcript_15263/g.38689  ORF Transcript_15263/g.38689 Transcript_15263/m.38689 type:complete len:262 (+) Transcript_15263:1588-2373(+)